MFGALQREARYRAIGLIADEFKASRRAARGPAVAGGCATRTPGNKVNWRSINKEEENYTNPGLGTGPVTSSQQSHLAKLRHTEPGVHETRDAPDILVGLRA